MDFTRAPRLPFCFCYLLVTLVVLPAQADQQPGHEPQRLTVQGTPEEIGAQVGAHSGAIIRQLHPLFLQVARTVSGRSQDDLYRRATAIGAHLAPEDRAEIAGLAKATGLTYQDVLFLNVFYSLSGQSIACRQLVAWGEQTADGELYHARNLDWPDYPGQPLQRHNLILTVQPERGIEHVVLTWPGLMSALTGTNRAGITVAFNALAPGKPATPAEPTFFTLRRVLRTARTLEEAVQIIRAARPMDNGSVMISDAGARRAAVVEIFDGRVGVRSGGQEELLGNANHPTREAGLTGVPGIGPADAPTCVVARELDVKLDERAMQQVMGHPHVIQQMNLLSVVFLPARNRMLLACGKPRAAGGPFREYVLFEEAGADAAAAARADASAPAYTVRP